MFNRAQNTDLGILKSVNAKEYPNWDETMRWTSDGVYPFMALSAGGIWLNGYIKKDNVMMRNGYKSVIAIGSTILITEALKRTIKRPRPYDEYPDEIILRTRKSGFSFPSGHTGAAFSTATALTLSTRKWYVAVPAYAYAGMVGYSRLRLGAHYGSDVLAGIIVGIGTSLLTWQVDKWVNQK
jgi:undecaprenyl-diphosphatase